jgi:MYXO-CTERM domain-containing protein
VSRRLGPLAFALLFLPAGAVQAKNLLSADGPGGTYDLLKTAYTVEVPDCGHMVDHITEELDAELGENVFVFHAHVDEDDDRCINSDRQRTEIRAKASDIVASSGETVYYRWKFKLDAGFQGSPNFTHLFQVKSDESAPVMTLTPRTETMAIDGRIGERGTTELSKFLGVWVTVDLSIFYDNAGNLALTIRRLSDGEVLFDYSGDADMWDDDASGHDSKFGIYRSLNGADYLRDEQVRFADFCASKVSASECQDEPPPSGGGTGGVGGSEPVGGGSSGGTGGSSGSAGSNAGSPGGGIGGSEPASGGTSPASAGSSATNPPASGGGAEMGTDAPAADAGCSCRAGQADRSFGVVLLALAAAASRRIRRRPGSDTGHRETACP